MEEGGGEMNPHHSRNIIPPAPMRLVRNGRIRNPRNGGKLIHDLLHDARGRTLRMLHLRDRPVDQHVIRF